MEYSVHLPGCDLATLGVALRLIYTGDIHLQDAADLRRVIAVCSSLGVSLSSLHSVNVTVDAELPMYVNHIIACFSFSLGVFHCQMHFRFSWLMKCPFNSKHHYPWQISNDDVILLVSLNLNPVLDSLIELLFHRVQNQFHYGSESGFRQAASLLERNSRLTHKKATFRLFSYFRCKM